MDNAMRRPSSTIGKRTPGRIRASFAGALAVFWLSFLPAATEVPGGEAQEPKSRVPPGIAARLSPATRARLNLNAGAARDTTRPAQAAAKADGRTGPKPSDDSTYRPTVMVRRGTSQGSGTIIASVDRETLVLTAAHVVRGQGPIVVELHRFNLGVERKTPGDGIMAAPDSLGARGLRPGSRPGHHPDRGHACAALRRPAGRAAMQILHQTLRVTSIGIDLGTELAGWSSRIVDTLTFELNESREQRPFLITENVPEHGRSGGGLFLANGELVGVCIGHAELVPGRRLGVFASRKSIRFLLEDHKLTAAILRSESRRARLSGRSTKRSEIVRRPASSAVTPTGAVEQAPR